MTTETMLGGVAEPTVATPAAGAETTTATTVATAAPAGSETGTAQADASVLDAEGKPVVAAKADEGAPEKYADFTAPEGVKAPAGELMTEFATLAKELGMSQAKAQDAFALVAKLAEKGSDPARQAAATEAARVAKMETYEAVTKADPEFGGEKLAENLAIAKAAMVATTTPELRKLLNETGLGSHAEVIRHFLKIAPAFAESKHVPGGMRPAGAGKSAAEVLYPTAAATA
jgi:hypothetical protein